MKLKKYKEFILENKISVDIPIPNDILEIANAYRKSGYDIFVVGGAIRDFLQGKTPHDYDLVTNALPNESKEILKGFNVSDEQGKNFGVLRVFTKDEPAGHEIASYRKDISKGRDTKGDEQKVEMGKHITIEDDVKRRDLTVNALFYNIVTKEIIDLVGGVDDIKNNIIRAVGIPSERFAEDRLRIMRCFRFAARTGGEIDSTTSNAIKDDNRLIGISLEEDVSTERIWDEINKSWEQAKDFNRYLGFFTKYKMWDQIFPGSKINTNFVDSKDFVVVIANLFKNESTDRLEDKLVQSYKIESDTAKKVVFLLKLLTFNVEEVFDIHKSKIQCGISDSTIIEWLKVNSIDEPMITKFVDYRPSVSSKVLMDKGIKGRELGLEIKRLESENFKKLYENVSKSNKIGEDIISELNNAIKRFGEYSYHDKGASEVMNLSRIDRELESKSTEEIIDILKYILDNHIDSDILVSELISNMDNREDFDDILDGDERFEY